MSARSPSRLGRRNDRLERATVNELGAGTVQSLGQIVRMVSDGRARLRRNFTVRRHTGSAFRVCSETLITGTISWRRPKVWRARQPSVSITA